MYLLFIRKIFDNVHMFTIAEVDWYKKVDNSFFKTSKAFSKTY